VKNISIIHKNNFFEKRSDKKKQSKLNKSFSKILNEINFNLEDTKDTFHVLSKKFQFNFNLKDLKKFDKFTTVAVVGMGGSILGSNAIYDFMKDKVKKKLIFFDNMDYEMLSNFKKKNNITKSLFIIISKSGHTIETLVNFISLNIIKKNAKNIIIISEKKDNLLFSISKKYNLYYIKHKKFLGGRYSVLSEVGIIPAYLMGVNIKKLRNNLEIYIKTSKKNFLKNSSIFLTKILNKKKYKNLIFLNYAPTME
jgi:glucose-6-phosphate isomerase